MPPSGNHDSRRIEGLESIYMNKIGLSGNLQPQLQGSMNGRRTSEGMRPIRPTMIQYLADDPAEAAHNFAMEGTMYHAGGNQMRTAGSPGRGSGGNASPDRSMAPVMKGNFVKQSYGGHSYNTQQ